MGNFVTVARVGEVEPGAGILVEVGGTQIALYNVDGAFFAIKNDCPHSYAPLIEGKFEGRIVTCFLHCWQFDVTTGDCPSIPGVRVDTFSVRVKGDEVQVATG